MADESRPVPALSETGAQPAPALRPSVSGARLLLRRLLRHRGALVGGIATITLILMAFLAPALAPYDPLEVAGTSILTPPRRGHWFGTDTLGRDLLSRVIFGSRISLRLGLISVTISLALGVILGLIAGYYEGRLGESIMRLIDVLLAFPGLLLAMLAVFVLGAGLGPAMVAVGIAGIPAFARVTRAEVLSAKQNLYVEAARAVGAPEPIILRRHMLPNIIAPNIVLATLRTGTAIILGASLSFLGLGAQSPTPEWGLMLNDGRGFLAVAWWLTAFPGLAIMVTVISLNLLGDGLRDVLDPRLRT